MWVYAVNVDEITNGTSKCVSLDGNEIIIFNLDGQFYALENRCSHMDFPLADGVMQDDTITCIYHGAKFSIQSGAPLCAPAYENVKKYEVSIEDGRIFLDV